MGMFMWGNNPVNFVDPLGLWAPSPYAVMHGKRPWEYGAWTGDALNDAMSQVADEVIPVRETVSAYQAGDYASLAWTFVSNFIKPLKLCPSFVTKETTTLYRAVSKDELADIAKNGFQMGPNAMGNKWFAESASDAAAWGKKFFAWDKEPVWTLKVTLPKSTADTFMRKPKLDNIGPARSADASPLQELNSTATVTVLMGSVVP